MAVTKSEIAHLISQDYKQIFLDNFMAEEPTFSKVFNIQSSIHSYEKMSGFTGLGLAPTKTEGSEATFDAPKQKVAKTFTHVTKSLGVRITKEAFDDDLSGHLRRIPVMLSDSMRATIETTCAQHFDRSQTAAYTGPDAKVLCATDHPAYGAQGAAWGNRPTANADLSVSALESAITALRTTNNDQGITTGLKARILLVPPAYAWMVQQLLVNPEQYGTANRNVNAIKAAGLVPVVWDYLTDTDSWYILTDKTKLQLIYINREPVGTKAYDAPDNTDDAIFRARNRFSSGWVSGLGIYGSIGA